MKNFNLPNPRANCLWEPDGVADSWRAPAEQANNILYHDDNRIPGKQQQMSLSERNIWARYGYATSTFLLNHHLEKEKHGQNDQCERTSVRGTATSAWIWTFNYFKPSATASSTARGPDIHRFDFNLPVITIPVMGSNFGNDKLILREASSISSSETASTAPRRKVREAEKAIKKTWNTDTGIGLLAPAWTPWLASPRSSKPWTSPKTCVRDTGVLVLPLAPPTALNIPGTWSEKRKENYQHRNPLRKLMNLATR